MYGFEGVGLSGVQLSISELSVVGGWWTRQTHFMVGPGRGPTKIAECFVLMLTAVSIAPEFYLKPSALACKEIQKHLFQQFQSNSL